MSTRACSRVYNGATLEQWFGNVMHEWEAHFDAEALKQGQQLYRDGKITGIELGENDAIINCAFERKNTCYAVLEWGSDGPEIRASIEDKRLGEAVAAAGLYEIEELIADEIDPLPFVPKAKEKPKLEENSRTPLPVKKNRGGGANKESNDYEGLAEKASARQLSPRLEGLETGLRLDAFWVDLEGGETQAFSQEKGASNSYERELLVRLTVMAKEVGFVYRRKQKDFMLSDPEKIPAFLNSGIPRWRKRFGVIKMNAEAERMSLGAQSIEVKGRVEAVQGARFKVDWRMQLGENWLSPEATARLAKAGRGTHIVKGLGLVRLAPAQTEALADWEVGMGSGDKTWPFYMVFSLFGERGASLDLAGTMKNWRADLLEGGAAKILDVELPQFLRDYQAHGVQWLANLQRRGCHGLLADEMGLGKTLQVLTLLRHHAIPGKHNLIVCPASVVPVWENEAARWYPELKTSILRSGNEFTEQGNEGAVAEEKHLWIASYTQLRRHKQLLNTIEFGYAVLDEAQQIKNPEAKVTHACCSIQAQCRLALTGTPLENRMLDLWTIFRFLMPGLLGTRSKFEVACQNNNLEARGEFEERLRTQIKPFIIRRLKDAVGKDLPPKVEMDLICPITDLQRSTYQTLLNEGAESLGGDLKAAMQSQAMHFFTLLTRLRQACCDPGLVPGVDAEILQSGKIQTLLVHLEDALNGNGSRKVVIFSQFVQLLKRLKPVIKDAFPKVALLELTGHTKDRQKPVASFQESNTPAVILVSLRAGGTGITLHAADYVFLLDPWWNPAVESQAVDRIHRIGQNRRVFVYRMITQGTVEARIQQLKAEKRELFENTLGGIQSASDLKEHFIDLQDLARLLPEATVAKASKDD